MRIAQNDKEKVRHLEVTIDSSISQVGYRSGTLNRDVGGEAYENVLYESS